MVDIPLASAPLPSSSSTIPSAGVTPVPIPVSITAVPSALLDTAHPVQITALPLAVLATNEVTLATTLGNLTVALAQQINGLEKQNLLRRLIALVTDKTSVALTLHSGSPPTQGTLIVPAPLANGAVQNVDRGQTQTASPPPQPLPPLAAGGEYRAVVLPPLPETASQTILPNAKVEAAYGPKEGAVQNTLSLPSASLDRAPSPPTTTDVAKASLPPSLLLAQEISANPSQATGRAAQVLPPPEGKTAPRSADSPQNASIPALRLESLLFKTTDTETLYRGPRGPDPSGQINAPLAPQTAGSVPAPQTEARPPASLSVPPAGKEVLLKVVAVIPEASRHEAASLLRPETPQQIRATVVGAGTEGQILLKSSEASFFIKGQATASVGTEVLLSVHSAEAESPLPLRGQDSLKFQALSEALETLKALSPHVFQNVMMNFLPQPTNALPGALLFLLGAFKQGNLRTWLGGDAVDTLDYLGKNEIISHLTKDLGTAGQPAQDAVVGNWKTYPIPLYAQNQLQELALHVHSDRDSPQDEADKTASRRKIRFLIDLRLSKLGALQLDGFVQAKKIDMVLRSEKNLPDGLHHDLRGAYIKALDAVGFTGALNFQIGRQHWLVIQKTTPPTPLEEKRLI